MFFLSRMTGVLLTGTLLLGLASSGPHAHDGDEHGDGKSSEDELTRVLIFSKTAWYRHPAIPELNSFLVQLGGKFGAQFDVSETPADFSRLNQYQAVIFNSTTDIGNSLDQTQRKQLKDWYQAGGGIMALHAAAVHHNTWPWWTKLVGCDFNSDSDFVKAKLIVDSKHKDHPTVKGYGPEFYYTADWTNHDKSVTGLPGVKVLLRIDETSYDPVREYFKTRGGKPMGKDHPVSWIREFEGGRFFYTELGHEVKSLDTKFGQQHLMEGLRWITRTKRFNRNPNKK
ncbi:MAG: ThuA domain-containing protein [Verrucomicrobiota bacterium]|nr:ThuA domain-containing protein [Verrucomicrobiota bacterium]